MKVPLRVLGTVFLKGLDGALTLAIKVDRWWTERQQREPKGLTFKDVQRMNDAAHNAGHERQRAKTVIIPRPKQ